MPFLYRNRVAGAFWSIVLLSSLTAVASAGGPKVGDVAPPLAISEYVHAPEGADASWDSLRGKVVIIEFWATWCAPCIGAIPHLNSLADQFSGEPVQFIAISNEEREPVARLLERREMRAWVVLDADEATFSAYSVVGIPHTVVVNPQGEIVAITHPNTLTAEHVRQVLAGEVPDIERRVTKASTKIQPGAEAKSEPPLLEIVIRRADGSRGMRIGPEVVEIHGVDAAEIVRHAFGISKTRLIGGDALDGGRYSLTARVPRSHADKLPSLLEESVKMAFNITAQRETRTIQALRLALPESGEHALVRSSREDLQASRGSGDGYFAMTNSPLSVLAQNLESQLGVYVEDATGVDGRFDVSLFYDQEIAQLPQNERIKAIAAVVSAETGLVLRKAEVDVECLVIQGISEVVQHDQPVLPVLHVSEHGSVEFVGLRSMSAEELIAKLPRIGNTDRPHYCAATLHSMGFADAAVEGVMVDGRLHWVVTVVDPLDADRVQRLPAPSGSAAVPEHWKPLVAHVTQTGPPIAFAIHHFGRTLSADARDIESAFEEFRTEMESSGMTQNLEPVRETWRLMRSVSSPDDANSAMTILRENPSPAHRVAALCVLLNFADDDSTWHALAQAARDPAPDVHNLAGVALRTLATHAARPVDWMPAADDVRHVLNGTALFAHQPMIRALLATDVSPDLACVLLKGGSPLLVSILGSHVPERRENARSLLVRLKGDDLGADPTTWSAWARSCPRGR